MRSKTEEEQEKKMPIITTPTTIPPVVIARLLERAGSPLAPLAEEIYDLAVCYRIDAAFALAQWKVESRLGCEPAAQVNRSAALVPLVLARMAAPAGSPHAVGEASPLLPPRYSDEHGSGYVTYPGWLAGLEEYFRLLREVFVDARHEERVEDIASAFLSAAPARRSQAPAAPEAGRPRKPTGKTARRQVSPAGGQGPSPIRRQAINAYTRQIERERALIQREALCKQG
jgi:hypothetical protein